jgi:hypothetical protein
MSYKIDLATLSCFVERAEEEKRGIIRWLRPEFQNPDNTQKPVQNELEGVAQFSAPPGAPANGGDQKLSAMSRSNGESRGEAACASSSGFSMGVRGTSLSGSHHIFSHDAIGEMLDLQEVSDEVKPYQIRQLLSLVERDALRLEGKE